MSRSSLDYEEFIYDNLLDALFDKEILEEALDERNAQCETVLIIRDSDYIVVINYAAKS